MSTKLVTVALVVFSALTLTHAALVNYRSGFADSQKGQEKSPVTNTMLYMQTRKFGVESISGYAESREIWRGATRSKWTERGLCCGVFDLLVSMKGGPTRISVLRSLRQPKNKLQLAYELDITWKAVDSHIEKMVYFGLVAETAMVGTCRIYSATEKGLRALQLADCQEHACTGKVETFSSIAR